MGSADSHYPITCAFCKISNTYPASTSPIPTDPDPEKLFPQCHLILSTPDVLAFLDIMPMAPGHLLLTTRAHHEKLSDIPNSPPSTTSTPAASAARELGAWLPRLSRALCAVTGVEDWNVVQNNGARAAQVVPHVHFHLIPRYQDGRREAAGAGAAAQASKSWRMFGRGAREDLDDDEGRELAGRLRAALRAEVEGGQSRGKL